MMYEDPSGYESDWGTITWNEDVLSVSEAVKFSRETGVRIAVRPMRDWRDAEKDVPFVPVRVAPLFPKVVLDWPPQVASDLPEPECEIMLYDNFGECKVEERATSVVMPLSLERHAQHGPELVLPVESFDKGTPHPQVEEVPISPDGLVAHATKRIPSELKMENARAIATRTSNDVCYILHGVVRAVPKGYVRVSAPYLWALPDTPKGKRLKCLFHALLAHYGLLAGDLVRNGYLYDLPSVVHTVCQKLSRVYADATYVHFGALFGYDWNPLPTGHMITVSTRSFRQLAPAFREDPKKDPTKLFIVRAHSRNWIRTITWIILYLRSILRVLPPSEPGLAFAFEAEDGYVSFQTRQTIGWIPWSENAVPPPTSRRSVPPPTLFAIRKLDPKQKIIPETVGDLLRRQNVVLEAPDLFSGTLKLADGTDWTQKGPKQNYRSWYAVNRWKLPLGGAHCETTVLQWARDVGINGGDSMNAIEALRSVPLSPIEWGQHEYAREWFVRLGQAYGDVKFHRACGNTTCAVVFKPEETYPLFMMDAPAPTVPRPSTVQKELARYESDIRSSDRARVTQELKEARCAGPCTNLHAPLQH